MLNGFLYVLGAYALLMLFVAGHQILKSDSKKLGVVLIFLSASILLIGVLWHYYALMMTGIVGIWCSAFYNGFLLHGKPNIRHHLVRGVISLLMMSTLWVSFK